MGLNIILVNSLIILWGVKCLFVFLLFFLLNWWSSFLNNVFI